MSKKKMIRKSTWKVFRESGMLWFANRVLHTFGWAIVYEFDNGQIKSVWPAKCRFRGFVPEAEERGFKRVTRYMKKNVAKWLRDIYE